MGTKNRKTAEIYVTMVLPVSVKMYVFYDEDGCVDIDSVEPIARTDITLRMVRENLDDDMAKEIDRLAAQHLGPLPGSEDE